MSARNELHSVNRSLRWDRRQHLDIAKPVRIGNDVWMGGNVAILSDATIRNTVVVDAGAEVTKNARTTRSLAVCQQGS